MLIMLTCNKKINNVKINELENKVGLEFDYKK